ncbi:hypothetical protein LAD12857_27710 [Lacrimispora amygdalina]|uniref:DUF4250 domain-containing protein n=1 Tax=Lacrimispora amygdalina TaxID=253257 RepID=A0A3E2NDD7_9FIRM|nr:DUF4250 domain-containing protein [Clostridium indicum]RFZ79005.1 DUF4250 domain-containing protein [Clostridium indicum]
MANIPKDPVMLLSYINTQLRDFYPSLNECCLSLGIEEEGIIQSLASIDYRYDNEKNQFV